MKKVNLKSFQDKSLKRDSKKVKGGSVILPKQYDLTACITWSQEGGTCPDPCTSEDDFL